jgi:hypothetical protein
MSKNAKAIKLERLRKRLFSQYNKEKYTEAARSGENLLNAYERLGYADSAAFSDD